MAVLYRANTINNTVSYEGIQTTEPLHDKTYHNNIVTSINSDQPVYLPNMETVLVYHSARRLWKAHAISEDSDQTARMRRLIWVFAGRTILIVGFVVR